MTCDYDEANALQRVLRRFAGSGPGSWLFARVLHHIDRPVYRLTGGRHTFASLLSGIPVVMLTTTGAKTGRRRTVPVLGLPTPGGLAVIASNFGQHNQPGWYYNLRANPAGEVDGRAVRATVAEGEERARIWAQGLRVYPGWSQYERRAAHRDIVVFVLRDPGHTQDMSEEKETARRSASAEAAALRGEEKDQVDPGHDAPGTGPEADDGVPNRHSASAEGANLRWQEKHEDDS
jgi:deazaflavin-dependent oxidoreductase (nitroreductase family)